jgi:hypothetical protein
LAPVDASASSVVSKYTSTVSWSPKPEPDTVTAVPGGPAADDNFSAGAAELSTVKARGLRARPAGVLTVIGPVVVPAATVAVIFDAEMTLKSEARRPWNLTALAPVRFDPLIVMVFLARPLPGVNAVILGVVAAGAAGAA